MGLWFLCWARRSEAACERECGDVLPRLGLTEAKCILPSFRVVWRGRCPAGAQFPAPGARRPLPGARCPAPAARCPVPGARCRCLVPGARCAADVRCPVLN